MKKIKWKGGALIAPLPPTLVSCGTMEAPNAITIAWTGITNTIPPKTYISVRPSRYSYDLIKEHNFFAINLTSADMISAVDYCGVRSGRDENKLEKTGLSVIACEDTGCPIIEDSPLSLVCKLTEIVPLGSHDMFLADILSVYVGERFIDKANALHLDKANLVAFSHGAYYKLGDKLGTFGFSVKKVKNRRRNTKSSANKKSK